MLLALFSSNFGGVIGIIILWYGALVGPMAIPMLLGLLTPFRRSGPAAAIACWLTGTAMFAALKIFHFEDWLGVGARYENAFTVGAPMFSSLFVVFDRWMASTFEIFEGGRTSGGSG